MQNHLERVSAVAELERAGVKFDAVGNGELRCKCPAHDDKTPSATINVEKNVWKCQASQCNAKGDIATFLALVLEVDRKVVVEDLKRRYNLDEVKTISSEVVERFHSQLKRSPHLDALAARGVTDSMMRAARLGDHNGRVTIPVYDDQRRVVDVLRYLPGAPPTQKMYHTKGYSRLRLYQVDDLKYDDVWVHGGPIKALVAKHLLNPHGVGAVSSTGGEGSWDPSWSPLFKGKRVWLCFDVDRAGKAATKRVGAMLHGYAAEVRVVELPLDVEKHPKGDFNDWVGAEGATPQDALDAAARAPKYEPEEEALHVERGLRDTTLDKAVDAANVEWRLRFEGVAAALADEAYFVPKTVLVNCTRSQPNCGKCPISRSEPDDGDATTRTVNPSSAALLELIGAPAAKMGTAMRRALHIPRCKEVEFIVRDHYRVNDMRLTPQIALGGEGAGVTMHRAYSVDCDVDMNTPYQFHAMLYPHPNNGQATLLVDSVRPTQDSLDRFKLEGPAAEAVAGVFMPADWTLPALTLKLETLHKDIEANVTRIRDQFPLHLAYDLAYHSPLWLPNLEDGGPPIKGWLNVLVIGDSAQGKSETFIRLQEHYGLGERVECKNATVPGLLGGVQQIGSRWFVTWGVLVRYDRRLVCLEEIKGAPVEVLGKLTDARSSGVAEIPKIERRRAFARTRLIAVSNPRANRQLGDYSFGVEAMQELVGAPEDLRRFDLGLAVPAGRVTQAAMRHVREAPHEAVPELCRNLILWAWTLTPDRIGFTDEAYAVLRDASLRLTAKYDSCFPLVDAGTAQQKLARIAAALAARTFSSDDGGGTMLVRPCHVEYAEQFVHRCYDDPAVGYDAVSAAMRNRAVLRDPRGVETFLRATRHPATLVDGLLGKDEVQLCDLQDWMQTDRDVAQDAMSTFVRHNALRRVGRSEYRKSEGFIQLLKRLVGQFDETQETHDDGM